MKAVRPYVFPSRKAVLTIPFLLLLVPGFSPAQQPPPTLAGSAGSGSAGSASIAEDWNSPSIQSNHLEPSTPLLGQIDEGEDFSRQMIQVQWRPGDPIYLYLIRPKGLKKPPAILYLYSFPSDVDRFRNDALCSLLVKKGFAAVGFVSALTGHRYHDRPLKEWFVSKLQESLGTSVHDVQMALNYLATRGDLDMNRIGMFGEGSGGSIAILASAVDARLKAIDLFAPWGDWADWLAKSPAVPEDERAQYLQPEFLKQVASLDPVDWLPRAKASAIRLQYADDQWGTPKFIQDRMKAAAPNRTKLVSYPDMKAEHGASATLFDWLKEQLTAAADRLHASAR
jgi:dienelactone hydrolase